MNGRGAAKTGYVLTVANLTTSWWSWWSLTPAKRNPQESTNTFNCSSTVSPFHLLSHHSPQKYNPTLRHCLCSPSADRLLVGWQFHWPSNTEQTEHSHATSPTRFIHPCYQRRTHRRWHNHALHSAPSPSQCVAPGAHIFFDQRYLKAFNHIRVPFDAPTWPIDLLDC